MYNVNKDTNEESLKDTVYEAGNQLHDSANKAGHKVRCMIKNASNDISNATEHLTDEIRNKPVRSSLLALGAGVLIATLLRK
jgi:gas vesicle protein